MYSHNLSDAAARPDTAAARQSQEENEIGLASAGVRDAQAAASFEVRLMSA
jgi:hypothetical protein